MEAAILKQINAPVDVQKVINGCDSANLIDAIYLIRWMAKFPEDEANANKAVEFLNKFTKNENAMTGELLRNLTQPTT